MRARNFTAIGIGALTIIFLVDVTLIGISALRFRRDKLMLVE